MTNKPHIRITENGPYMVSGGVHLREEAIVPGDKHLDLKETRQLPQSEEYALCRCGNTSHAPFCDGTHETIPFDGTETAGFSTYEERAGLEPGRAYDLADDQRCAYARFCHRAGSEAWTLAEEADTKHLVKEGILAAENCPAGRLTPYTHEGEPIEPHYEPQIADLIDTQEGVGGPLAVRGEVPLESTSGEEYQVRNRMALCRCGQSRNKPFCDASHVNAGFQPQSVG